MEHVVSSSGISGVMGVSRVTCQGAIGAAHVLADVGLASIRLRHHRR